MRFEERKFGEIPMEANNQSARQEDSKLRHSFQQDSISYLQSPVFKKNLKTKN